MKSHILSLKGCRMENDGRTTTLSQEQVLEDFIDRMIEEKGVPKTDRLRAELEERLSDAVMTEILMNLPDYLLDKINAAYSENTATDELIASIVAESGIDTTQITEKAILNFREEYLN